VAAAIEGLRIERRSDGLGRAAATCLLVMLLGQWAFFYYIAMHYGGSALSGNLEVWNRLAVFGVRPFIAGDAPGNLTFLSHALAAGVIALGGALQLVPQVRARFPRFHRWNGRLFLLTVLGLSLSGFYLVLVRSRDPVGFGTLGILINGGLILGFAAATWRAIRRRDLAAHREWALRLYLVSNAQWFTRIGMFAYMVFVKLSGLQPIPAGTFFELWKFGCFLVPLALLQLYFVGKRSRNTGVRMAISATLFAASVAMALGSAAFGAFSLKIISGAPLG
jgi:hypothetical protein